MVAGYFGTQAIINFISTSAQAYDKQVQAESRVEQAIKSTGGAAKLTADQLKATASELQSLTTFGDEDILTNVTTNLLTFTKVSGSVFKDAQKAILDISTVLGQDLQSSTIQVGKALNDPIQGITALKRVGVSFTEEQKKVIQRLTETGQVAEAQKLILQELNREFGGQAEAAAKRGMGAVKQLENAWGDFKENIGSQYVPALSALAKAALDGFNKFSNFLGRADTKVSVDSDESRIQTEVGKYAEADAEARKKMLARYEADSKIYFDKWKQAKDKEDAEAAAHYATQYSLTKETVEKMKAVETEASETRVEGLKAEGGIINELEAKIKSLTESKAKANSLDEIRRINDRVEALQSEKKIYEELSNTINRMPAKKGMSMSEVMGDLQGRVDAKNQAATDRRMQQRDVPLPAEMSPALAPGYSEQMQAGWAAWGEEMTRVRDIANEVNTAISAGMADMASFVGESIGALITGTADMGDVFSGLLGLVADFMKNLGQALVAAGFASQAFQSLFANPFAAIAAGTALIALASVVKGLLQKGPAGGGGEGVRKFADGGVIFGPTFGLMGEYAGASRDPEVVSPLSTLKGLIGGNDQEVTVYGALRGDDLLISNNRTVYRHSRVKG